MFIVSLLILSPLHPSQSVEASGVTAATRAYSQLPLSRTLFDDTRGRLLLESLANKDSIKTMSSSNVHASK